MDGVYAWRDVPPRNAAGNGWQWTALEASADSSRSPRSPVPGERRRWAACCGASRATSGLTRSWDSSPGSAARTIGSWLGRRVARPLTRPASLPTGLPSRCGRSASPGSRTDTPRPRNGSPCPSVRAPAIRTPARSLTGSESYGRCGGGRSSGAGCMRATASTSRSVMSGATGTRSRTVPAGSRAPGSRTTSVLSDLDGAQGTSARPPDCCAAT